MISDFCIKRPVFAAVLSLLIIVLGIASLLRLPIRELPDVDSAIVGVTTTYLGASPEIVDTDVTEVVESAVAGVAGVKSITSTSQRGRGRTVIEFEPGRNIDEAANDVRDAVARVRPDLPDDVDEPQVAKSDSDSDPMMRIAVTSDRMSAAEITDYVERFVLDRLSTLEGIAQVRIFGERRYAIRVWLDRRAMAARNLTVDDVEQALRRNNVELPAGELKSTTRQFTVRAQSRLASVEQFEHIMIERIDGYPIRLADIARIERGVEDDESIVRSHGREAVGLGVLRQSQANTIAISNRVRDQLDLIRPNLPVGMEISIGSDDAMFINESIREVVRALGIAVVLVVLVIFAFLASARATLVPAVAIPVAVIGAFIGIYALGFSINVLTLLALILAIGIVVDDAIVVLENVQRRIELGESPLIAGVLGTRQVTFAVIATSLTLIAVFVPISFVEGQIGRLFTEFGFVLGAAVAISMLVSLTLCPALCTKLLSDGAGRGRAARLVERGPARRDPRLPLAARAQPGRAAAGPAHRAADQRRLVHALSRPAPGADPQRRPRRVLHPGHRAPGLDGRLHRCARAPGRGDPAAHLRQWRGGGHFREFRPQRPGASGLRGGAPGSLGRARARPAGDHPLAHTRAVGAARRARLPDQPGGPRPARQPHAAAGRDRRSRLSEHQGVER